MRYLIVLLALTCGISGAAQGVVPIYATRVDIFYRAVAGHFPTEENIPPPAYPPEMRRAALEDTVPFTALVGQDGRVSGIVTGDSKFPEFRQVVQETLPTWRFRPWRGGAKEHAAPVQLRGEIRFRIVED
jgi:hypothetical protein